MENLSRRKENMPLTNHEPLFTVVVISYSRKEFIMDALKSVANQDFPKESVELIVIKNYIDEHIDEYIGSINGRSIYSRNKSLGRKIKESLEVASGKYIAFMDDDDYWNEGRLTQAFNYLNSGDFCYYHTNQIFIDVDGRPIGVEKEPAETKAMDQAGLLCINKFSEWRKLGVLYSINPDFNLSSMIFETKVLSNYKELIYSFDTALDSLLFYIAMSTGKDMLFDPARMTYYRQHRKNVSVLSKEVSYGEVKKIIDFSNRRANAFRVIVNSLRPTEDQKVYRFIIPIHLGLSIINMTMENSGTRLRMLILLFRYIINSHIGLLKFRKDFLYYGINYLVSPKLSQSKYYKRHGLPIS